MIRRRDFALGALASLFHGKLGAQGPPTPIFLPSFAGHRAEALKNIDSAERVMAQNTPELGSEYSAPQVLLFVTADVGSTARGFAALNGLIPANLPADPSALVIPLQSTVTGRWGHGVLIGPRVVESETALIAFFTHEFRHVHRRNAEAAGRLKITGSDEVPVYLQTITDLTRLSRNDSKRRAGLAKEINTQRSGLLAEYLDQLKAAERTKNKTEVASLQKKIADLRAQLPLDLQLR